MFNMADMMKQAQAMQTKMQEMQEGLANVTVQGQAGGGMVKVTMTCKGIMTGLQIDPAVIDPNDPDMVADLVIAASNDAREKIDTTIAERTKEMMGGMGLPGDFKLPF